MSTNWEAADVLKTPMEICWQFDYDIEIDKLRNLYSKLDVRNRAEAVARHLTPKQ